MLLEVAKSEPLQNEANEAQKNRNLLNGIPESSSLLIGFIALMTVLFAVYGVIFLSLKIMHCRREDEAFRHSRMFEDHVGGSTSGSVESVDDRECL